MRRLLALACLPAAAAALLLATGCGKPAAPAGGEGHAHHHHDPKHGGVLIELGEEEYHLEIVHGETPGLLQAYVLDGHVENYVRVDLPSFPATVRSGGRELPVVFQATTSSATGEKVGDSALFESATDLTGKPALTLIVPSFTLKGRTYRDLTADLPAARQP